ncbi:MAG: PEP-CTERM sorting domain-containing protein [Rhodoferax sp.]|nr:PEP-CTERM sorting domain-containing protein [Rhodoferax sp.]
MALDEFNRTTLDSEVWLYKPLVSPVPESSTPAMLLLGLAVLGVALRKRRVN